MASVLSRSQANNSHPSKLYDHWPPLSTFRTPEGITEEGIAGYFTYGLNANVALSVQAGANPLPFSGGIRFRLPLTEEYGTTGFNNDVSFDASASALTLSVPYLGEVSAVTTSSSDAPGGGENAMISESIEPSGTSMPSLKYALIARAVCSPVNLRYRTRSSRCAARRFRVFG